MSTGTNGFIPTEPKDDVRVIKYVKINGVSITPFKGAMINVDTFTEEKSWVYNRLLNMNTQSYLEWNNDDTFLISWILSQLGLSPDPTPPIPSGSALRLTETPPSPLVRSDGNMNMNLNYIPEEQEQPVSPKNDFIEV